MSDNRKFLLLFFALFAFRTAFGLCHSFFSPDELQTYLIGLKWYCHGGWPYFGPDLTVTETGFYAQIPGPLEAWMVGYPLVVWPIPEAPFLFLNLLTTGVIALLAWYLSKRLPDIPLPFLFAWIALLPWNLQESTNPLNPSYLLIGSTLFFLGFLEAVPSFSMDFLPPAVAFALMGFGIFWDMQFHQSWLLLPPFAVLAFALRLRDKRFHFVHDFVSFLVGAAPLAALLMPTYLKYGLTHSEGGFQLATSFNPSNFLAFFTMLGRYLSLPCFETLRFLLEAHQVHHMDFFRAVPWLLPPGLFLIVMGWLQALSLIVLGWFKDPRRPEARTLSKMALFGFLLVWVSFWFTSKLPFAHIDYVLMPLLVVYSLYAWSRWASQKRWRLLGVICLAANLWFQAGWMIHMEGTQSLYTNRAKVAGASRQKDDQLLGERRPGSVN